MTIDLLQSILSPLPGALELGPNATLAAPELLTGTAAGAVDPLARVFTQGAHAAAKPPSGLLSPVRRKEQGESGAEEGSKQNSCHEPGGGAIRYVRVDRVAGGYGRHVV
jgi:hypothetical protein